MAIIYLANTSPRLNRSVQRQSTFVALAGFQMRLLAVVQLGASSDRGRVRDDVPEIIKALSRCADGAPENAFRSSDGMSFGFFLTSDQPLGKTRSMIEGSTGFRNSDALLLLEIGPEVAGAGFSRAWTWLQHHPAR